LAHVPANGLAITCVTYCPSISSVPPVFTLHEAARARCGAAADAATSIPLAKSRVSRIRAALLEVPLKAISIVFPYCGLVILDR
jgi:hypothetical protein